MSISINFLSKIELYIEGLINPYLCLGSRRNNVSSKLLYCLEPALVLVIFLKVMMEISSRHVHDQQVDDSIRILPL